MANKLSKKTKKIIKENTMVAVVIASFLINIFFFTGLVIYNTTNDIDYAVYNETKSNFCNDGYVEYLNDRKAISNDVELDAAMINIECVSGDFQPYHDQAVEEYLSDLGF